MKNIIKKIIAFFKYWYFRYTLVTELYMVDNWERHFINVFLVTLFCIFFYFNYKVLLPATSYFIAN